MKRCLLQGAISLLIFDGVFVAICLASGNWQWLMFIALNTLGAYMIVANGFQIAISRARPVYNQKDKAYYTRTLLLWWAFAILYGLTLDGLFYFMRPSQQVNDVPFVGTALALLCAVVLTVLWGAAEIITNLMVRKRTR